MSDSYLSKKEIARQFDLPERGAKIASLLRQEQSEGGERVYCICKQSHTDVFMIGCDSCEEWFHGECVNIREKDSKYIEAYYCRSCKMQDPRLHNKYKQKKEGEDADNSKKSRACKECSNCKRISNCGICDYCKGIRTKHIKRCLQRQCLNPKKKPLFPVQKKSEDDSKDWDYKPSYREDKSDDEYYEPRPKKSKLTKIKEKQVNTKKRGRRSESPGTEELVLQEPRQCYGPNCVEQSRRGSKYCSDECGYNLATARIMHILPRRIHEWNMTPCAADEKNKKQLEIVRKQQTQAQEILKQLEQRHKEIEMNILKGKSQSIDPKWRDNEEDFEGETPIFCVTCGHEVNCRIAIRHMEKCFNKYESQTSYGSAYKTRVEGSNMFCDYYNSSNGTYCKRLRVLCPEHYKEPKVSESEVCGCPLVNNVFGVTEEFCRAPKKNCLKHYCWDKLRRAEVDMERVRQWLKFDELLEQERQIRVAMSNRAGVLPLMLHYVCDHKLMEQMAQQQT